MRLIIKKSQSKGMLGGINFDLFAKVELDKDEAALVQKYNAGFEVLLQREIKIPLTGKSIIIDITIGSLTQGQIFKGKNIVDIITYESNVKESCEAFKTYLEVMRAFGGEEVIEY